MRPVFQFFDMTRSRRSRRGDDDARPPFSPRGRRCLSEAKADEGRLGALPFAFASGVRSSKIQIIGF